MQTVNRTTHTERERERERETDRQTARLETTALAVRS